jgi:hypothetical protein
VDVHVACPCRAAERATGRSSPAVARGAIASNGAVGGLPVARAGAFLERKSRLQIAVRVMHKIAAGSICFREGTGYLPGSGTRRGSQSVGGVPHHRGRSPKDM